MGRDYVEVVKDEVWKAGVQLSRPRTTLREAIRDLVFDAVGTEVYDDDWDLLLVLDACRADLFRTVADDYDFIESVDTAYSKASSSREWIVRNFRAAHRDHTRQTAYVTGNPFSDSYLDDDDFALLDEVWRYEWDRDVGTLPPEVLTDRAIEHAREDDYDRMIVHYMQPHFPSIPDPDLGSAIDPETNVWIESVWDRLESGDLSRDRLWDAYRANLEHVLDSVELLLENVDAENVVITADHGNAFGEDGIYGHPRLRTHRVLREVPWATATAVDERTHEPATADDREVEDDVEERLADLGYR